MGYYNRPTDKQASEDYLEKTEKELQEARRRVIGDLGEKLALIQGGELKALGPGGEELTQALLKDPQQALAQYAEILNQRFDMGAEKIRALAQERQATISQRMGVIECKYWPEQTVFFPKIIVRIRVAENQVWLAFKLINDNTIVTDESVDTENLSLLSQSEEEAQNWLARGYNILLIEAEDNLAIKAQLHKVLSDHFQKVLVNEDAS